MVFNWSSAAIERLLGIAVPERSNELGALRPIYDEIVSQPWFDPHERDTFRRYMLEKFTGSDMELRQKRSLLMAVARRYYSKAR